jgi:hypothetical protein
VLIKVINVIIEGEFLIEILGKCVMGLVWKLGLVWKVLRYSAILEAIILIKFYIEISASIMIK